MAAPQYAPWRRGGLAQEDRQLPHRNVLRYAATDYYLSMHVMMEIASTEMVVLYLAPLSTGLHVQAEIRHQRVFATKFAAMVSFFMWIVMMETPLMGMAVLQPVHGKQGGAAQEALLLWRQVAPKFAGMGSCLILTAMMETT